MHLCPPPSPALHRRGFRVVKRETRELVYDKPGQYAVADADASS